MHNPGVGVHNHTPSRLHMRPLTCAYGTNSAAKLAFVAQAKRMCRDFAVNRQPPHRLCRCQAVLLDSFYETDRGLTVSSEARAEISELITQLEAKNPTPAPTEAIDKLSGRWKLLYTVNSELSGLLGLGRIPGVEVGEISQTINALNLSATNSVTIGGQLSRTTVSAKAALEVQSPKRVQVRFERSIIETPELLTDREFPSSVNFLGQPIDLTNLKDALQPFNASVRSTAEQVSRYLQGKPNLDVAIPGGRGAQSWLLTTYLDDDLRVSRGDNGAIFVLAKDTYSL